MLAMHIAFAVLLSIAMYQRSIIEASIEATDPFLWFVDQINPSCLLFAKSVLGSKSQVVITVIW